MNQLPTKLKVKYVPGRIIVPNAANGTMTTTRVDDDNGQSYALLHSRANGFSAWDGNPAHESVPCEVQWTEDEPQ